jgi:hypothetical protein
MLPDRPICLLIARFCFVGPADTLDAISRVAGRGKVLFRTRSQRSLAGLE